MIKNFIRRALPIAALSIPATVHAHPGHGAADLVSGMAHPLLGADHMLAMVAVGLLGAQLGGRARWALPAAFVGALAAGTGLGISGFTMPGMEHGIALSVLVLGTILAFAMRMSLPAAAFIAAVCGVFHGSAHGVEMPADASGMAFSVGMIAASAALHAAGLGIGSACMSASRASWLRFAGAATAVAALGMFVL